ncbi:MAG: substrate-binding domain-containing protein [Spiroplasma phoeniceum]|nr:MAG: substrate-binding domain-containing protein [Spiroplasma phoeniceum]
MFGASTSAQGLMNSVLKKFNKEHNIRVAYNSSSSSGGETGIKNNTLVFGFTSWALKTEFTKDPYAGLKFAVDGILLIANLPSDCQESNLNLDLISSKVDVLKSIYEGETKTWGDLLECQSTKKSYPPLIVNKIQEHVMFSKKNYKLKNLIRNYEQPIILQQQLRR